MNAETTMSGTGVSGTLLYQDTLDALLQQPNGDNDTRAGRPYRDLRRA